VQRKDGAFSRATPEPAAPPAPASCAAGLQGRSNAPSLPEIIPRRSPGFIAFITARRGRARSHPDTISNIRRSRGAGGEGRPSRPHEDVGPAPPAPASWLRPAAGPRGRRVAPGPAPGCGSAGRWWHRGAVPAAGGGAGVQLRGLRWWGEVWVWVRVWTQVRVEVQV